MEGLLFWGLLGVRVGIYCEGGCKEQEAQALCEGLCVGRLGTMMLKGQGNARSDRETFDGLDGRYVRYLS